MGEFSTRSAERSAEAIDVVLPAVGITVGTSLVQELVLVGHAGRTHVGITVRRPLARQLERAWFRRGAPDDECTMDDASLHRFVERPDVIRFRWATSHEIRTVGGRVFLVLHSAGALDRPGVQVECRVDASLLRELGRLAARRPDNRGGRFV